MKQILLIDGQGGKLGKQLAESILAEFTDIELIAVGTNSIATSSMLKGGAKSAATGENAVIVNARHADVILGPIGIVIADSLLGEITPAMALSVAQSRALKILIPSGRCNHLVAGTSGRTLTELTHDALNQLRVFLGQA